MIERSKCCPKCKSTILARVDNGINDDNIYCLNSSCNWNIPAKREEDKQLPEIHELRSMWGET